MSWPIRRSVAPHDVVRHALQFHWPHLPILRQRLRDLLRETAADAVVVVCDSGAIRVLQLAFKSVRNVIFPSPRLSNGKPAGEKVKCWIYVAPFPYQYAQRRITMIVYPQRTESTYRRISGWEAEISSLRANPSAKSESTLCTNKWRVFMRTEVRIRLSVSVNLEDVRANEPKWPVLTNQDARNPKQMPRFTPLLGRV